MVSRNSLLALSLTATLLGACGSRSGHPEVPIGYTLATEHEMEEARGSGEPPRQRRSPVVSASISHEGLGVAEGDDAEADGDADGDAVADTEGVDTESEEAGYAPVEEQLHEHEFAGVVTDVD